MCVNHNKDIFKDIINAAEKFSSKDAMVIDGIHYSYRDLICKAKGIAAFFNDPTERIIGIIAENKIETYASILATLLTGRTYVILHPAYPPERNIGIIKQIGPDGSALLTSLPHPVRINGPKRKAKIMLISYLHQVVLEFQKEYLFQERT